MKKGSDFKFLVVWKYEKNHTELFESLEVFCASYPRYKLNTLAKYFAFHGYIFEDDMVRLEKKWITRNPKPDFPRSLFWDVNYDRIDWKASQLMVVQRILERGQPKHWRELERFYGRNEIISLLKNEINYLPDYSIDEASSYFQLKKEELLCYIRKQSYQVPWP